MNARKTLSIRDINILFVMLTVLFSIGVLVGNHFLRKQYLDALNSQETMLACTDAANALQSESDELTLFVNSFIDEPTKKSLDDYYKIIDDKLREREIERAKSYNVDCSALEEALEWSNELAERETHAFSLIAAADGAFSGDAPIQVREYKLTEGEEAMSGAEKLSLAYGLIRGSEYNEFKRRIYSCISAFENVVLSAARDTLTEETHDVSVYIRMLRWLSLVCSALSIVLALVLYKTVTLVLERDVRAVAKSEHISPSGVRELRFFADVFNEYVELHKSEQAELKRQAELDPLTGIANRGALESFVRGRLAEGGVGALVFVDVDNFKMINDTFGHDAGDAALKLLAGRLKKGFMHKDFVGRIGGDEFAVWLDGVTEQKADFVAGKISELCTDTLLWCGDTIRLRVSAGVSFCCAGDSYDDALKRADIALYKVKRRGKNGCGFYHE